MDDSNTKAAKRLFAEKLLKWPNNAATIAFQVCDDPMQAADAALTWKDDPYVLGHQRKLLKANPAAAVLSREELAREVLDLAQDSKKLVKERTDAFKLAAEVLGYTGNKAVKANGEEAAAGAVNAVSNLLNSVASQGRPAPKGE